MGAVRGGELDMHGRCAGGTAIGALPNLVAMGLGSRFLLTGSGGPEPLLRFAGT
jgi:hypothetical protein